MTTHTIIATHPDVNGHVNAALVAAIDAAAPLWHERLRAAAAIERIVESRVPLRQSVVESQSEPVMPESLTSGAASVITITANSAPTNEEVKAAVSASPA